MYIKYSTMLNAVKKGKTDRAAMFRYLLDKLLPDDVLADEALSYSGRAETAGIPPSILNAITGVYSRI